MIAQKNTQQQKGPESIFIYMGLGFLFVDLLMLIMLFLFSWEINSNFMIPLIYFFMLSGIHFGMGSYMREYNYDEISLKKNLKNWYIGLIFIGIIVGAILGAYMW